MRRVLHLEPIRRTAGAIGRVLPLAHNAFEPELAGVCEHGRAVLVLDVLIERTLRLGVGWVSVRSKVLACFDP
jgi:hypothetical protein